MPTGPGTLLKLSSVVAPADLMPGQVLVPGGRGAWPLYTTTMHIHYKYTLYVGPYPKEVNSPYPCHEFSNFVYLLWWNSSVLIVHI